MAFALVSPLVMAQENLSQNETQNISLTDENLTEVSPGVGPDSIFYGLDRAMERISLALTFNRARKAEKALRIADERLAEVEAMIKKNKSKAADIAQRKHDKILDYAEKEIVGIDSDGNVNASEKALERISKIRLGLLMHSERIALIHQRILDRLSQNPNVSAEKIAHLEEVFSKIENKSRFIEQKVAQRRKNIRTKYKVLSQKNESELTEQEKQFLDKVNKIKERINESNLTRQEMRNAINKKIIRNFVRKEIQKRNLSNAKLNQSTLNASAVVNKPMTLNAKAIAN